MVMMVMIDDADDPAKSAMRKVSSGAGLLDGSFVDCKPAATRTHARHWFGQVCGANGVDMQWHWHQQRAVLLCQAARGGSEGGMILSIPGAHET